MFKKYVKPRSLTWWASFVPLACGLVVASEPIHGAALLVQTIDNATGGMSAAMLVNLGLAGIGLRGAVEHA